MMTTEAFLSLLQFTDGLFPAGAHAHSFGLESYVEDGTVRDAAGAEGFLRALLEGSSGPTDAVVALWAWRAGRSDDLQTCLRIDETFDAMKPAAELRNASRQMGRQVLRIASSLADASTWHGQPAPTCRARPDGVSAGLGRVGPGPPPEGSGPQGGQEPVLIPQAREKDGGATTAARLVTDLFQAAESGLTPGHHPVAFGVAGSVLGWPPEETAAAYLYSTGAAVVAAALRLLPLGQLAGQRILAGVRPLCGRLAKQARVTGPEGIWSFAPGLEIAAMRHATLEARLFRS